MNVKNHERPLTGNPFENNGEIETRNLQAGKYLRQKKAKREQLKIKRGKIEFWLWVIFWFSIFCGALAKIIYG